MSGFKFFTLELQRAETNYKFKHGLTFIPQDVIITSTIGSGLVTLNYELFDKTYIDLTTTNAVKLRFYLGSQE